MIAAVLMVIIMLIMVTVLVTVLVMICKSCGLNGRSAAISLAQRITPIHLARIAHDGL